MPEHVHGCLNCRPEMVPDFSRDDPRYHAYEKCGVTLRATVDGVVPGYHKGVFEGAEGWVLLACEGFDAERVHDCPNCTTYHDYEGYPVADTYSVCLTPRFGKVGVIHDCPADRKRTR
jgi:hypothetical protein